MSRTKTFRHLIGVGLVAAAAALAGCAGDDGDLGPQGLQGDPGPKGDTGDTGGAGQDLTSTATALNVAFDRVTFKTTGEPMVEFTVTNQDGHGYNALSQANVAARQVRFAIAKLVPAKDGNPSFWRSYVNTEEVPSGANNVGSGAGGTPALARATQATAETASTAGTLTRVGNGRYTYTFKTQVAKGVAAPVAVTYEPTLTHRVAIQIGGGLPITNPTYDFVPAGGTVSQTREVALTKACNECHDQLLVHGNRIEMKYCVMCHNPDTTDANSGNNLDMATMTHKIHMGLNLPSVKAGGSYAIWGFGASKHDYSGVGYPSSVLEGGGVLNCRKCHTGDVPAANKTAHGGNWQTVPTIGTCGACHDDVNFATGAGHGPSNLAQADNKGCVGCHPASQVRQMHRTNNPTPNNPDVGAGLASFAYEIKGVTVDGSSRPVVTFRVLKDGAPILDLKTTTTFPSLGFTGGPSFLLAYALPQGGVTTPADYNNLGRAAAQPASVTVASVRAAMTDPDADGYQTATLTTAFPAGATLRAVGMQGTFVQQGGAAAPFHQVDVNGDGSLTRDDTVTRYVKGVVKEVTGDAKRRVVVDNAKCLGCHEQISAHGRSRTNEVALCLVCHVPNLSSSGRGADLTTSATNVNTLNTIAKLGNDPLTYPETSQNFKDLIHGLHAGKAGHGAGFRGTDFKFVRDRGTSGVFLWDFSHMTYPGILSNCLGCHLAGTYELDKLPRNLLPTTVRTSDGTDATPAAVVAARGGTKLPNATDQVMSPMAAACAFCHDDFLAQKHMEQNGAFAGRRDAQSGVETCLICHGPGRSSDVKVKHGVK